MKPFRFSLELLRVLRKQKERVAQQRYVGALAARNTAELELQRAATELAVVWNLLGQELGQGIAASRLADLRAWCHVLETRWTDHKTSVETARRTADQAFHEMTLAARDREALDRFYDKSRRVYDREAQREEQKTIDELAVQLNSTPGPLQFTRQNN
jgi:flagellar export protein FliJ